MSTAMYKALGLVDQRPETDPGYLGTLNFTPSNGFVPQTLSLGLSTVRPVNQVRTNRDGSDDSTRRLGARPVGIAIALLPEGTGMEEEELAEILMEWMHPSLRPLLVLSGGRGLFVRSEAMDVAYDFTTLNYTVANCTWVAPDGNFVSAVKYSRTIVYGFDPSSQGRVYDLYATANERDYPDLLPENQGNTVVCANTGRKETFPTVTWHGPLTDPGIINVTTHKRLVFGGGLVLAEGDTLRVDFQTHQVLFNGAVAYYQRIDFRVSEFWSLPRQSSCLVRGLAGAWQVGATALVEWRDQW